MTPVAASKYINSRVERQDARLLSWTATSSPDLSPIENHLVKADERDWDVTTLWTLLLIKCGTGKMQYFMTNLQLSSTAQLDVLPNSRTNSATKEGITVCTRTM
ncbi:hypothetical protein TNCV_4183571 [Trichonephila clavipes]|nr:hypothetical protein TNCV_4183571 [Trichonephila clavipes]